MATYYVRKQAAFENPTSPTGYYYFDGSDAAATDPGTVWTDETNADDGSTSTVAYTTTTGSSVLNYLKIEGTNAPASGATINTVHVRVFYGPTHDSSATAFTVYTDGEAQSLGEYFPAEGSAQGKWAGGPTTYLIEITTTPTGGWTWAKVQALEIKLYLSAGSRMEFAKVDVIVNAGDDPDNPMGYIDEAANAVAAGDTVYVGAGVYREQVTMDTAGTSGNLISYIADVDGEQTGDAGLVIISAYANETSAATRTACWNPNGKEFITVQGFTMTGGTFAVVYDGLLAGNRAYEEVTFEDCVFVSGDDQADYTVRMDLNLGATPTTAGLTFRRCVFQGNGTRMGWSENPTAEVDCKMTYESCLAVGLGASGVNYALVHWDRGTPSTYHVGGVTVTNCTVISMGSGLFYAESITPASPTNTIDLRNNTVVASLYGAYNSQNNGFVTSDYNTFAQCNTPLNNITAGGNDRQTATDPGLVGGISDVPLYTFLGWSPWKPWEPIHVDDGVDAYTHAVIGASDTTVAPAFDLYNEARPMGARSGERTDVYYFDSSDAGPTDNGGVWTNDTNIDDGDPTTSATSTTTGSTNWLRTEGTNAPATGGTISLVEFRWNPGSSGDTDANVTANVYTDGQSELVYNVSASPAANIWTSWYTTTPPTGGWTWAAVQALEADWFYASGGTTAAVAMGQIRVTSTPTGQDDQGAVEARTRPTQETTTVRTGTNAIQLGGAGYHDFLVPVKNQSTTVSIYGRYDSNYTGSLPILEVLNIDGVADQSDVMVAAANTWEELTATFTPTADGVCRVRVRSRDTSSDGEAFFDDLTVT